MKSFVAFVALISSTALAAPSTMRYAKRQTSTDPSTSAVENAINAWNIDVDAVNLFLNNALSQPSSQLVQLAQSTLQRAQDEPNQLSVLASISDFSNDGQYQGAVLNLKEVFGNVPASLQNIIDNPDVDNVQTQLQQINNVRCCNVLPDLGILWQDAADDYGISNVVNTVPARPDACATTAC